MAIVDSYWFLYSTVVGPASSRDRHCQLYNNIPIATHMIIAKCMMSYPPTISSDMFSHTSLYPPTRSHTPHYSHPFGHLPLNIATHMITYP